MKFTFGLQHPLACKPLNNPLKPCNKVRGEYFLKKSSCVLHSCVFLPASFILASVIIASVCIQYIYVCNSLGTVLNVTISWHGTTITISRSRLPTPIPAPNVIPLCTITLFVPDVIIMISLILVTMSNAVL